MPGLRRRLFGLLAAAMVATPALASDFSRPWQRPDTALVIDAYEYNAIDWNELVTDKRITGFINKASDGLPPAYKCSGTETETRLCKALWKRFAVAKELYHTRRMMAKALGLSWGAYHLARPGNPIDQANHFIDFADPKPDELIAIDIEDNTSDWMSLEDAEIFVGHIHKRLGRWPVLYTNGNTSKFIADNRARYPLLSRLNLWYARYKPEIGEHFPKGNWTSYALWQFATQVNCSRRACPYRPPGTPADIDLNVAAMTPAELKRAWPFSGLVEEIAPPVPEVLVASAGGEPVVSAGEIALPVLRSDAGFVAPRLVMAQSWLAPVKDRLEISFGLRAEKTEAVAEPVAEAEAPVLAAVLAPEPLPSSLVKAYAAGGNAWPKGRGETALAMLDRLATGSVAKPRADAKALRFAPKGPPVVIRKSEVSPPAAQMAAVVDLPVAENEGSRKSGLEVRLAMIPALGFGEIDLDDFPDEVLLTEDSGSEQLAAAEPDALPFAP
ncbi:glycoside hydrolase family 25 protein [Aestuariivirga sp.]|uniref:glycoside hydrolase family 25 protein n=1 Tax=Aestuariivirga sp. TaxID=2650926 RepID=UPI003592F213